MATTVNFRDIYREVTDAVIEQLENGKLVWRCGWNQSGLPSNVTTGICYRGWNVFWLNFHTITKGYPTSQYLTFKQALELGGNIRKGEKGTRIVYWASIQLKQVGGEQELVDDENAGKCQRMVPKVYTVFNIAQTEGIEFPPRLIPQLSATRSISACEELLGGMPERPEIKLNGQYPVYYPTMDVVSLPPISAFDSAGEYYSALFHELAHSTGHASRLNRQEITAPAAFGSEPYCREELTAEMTSAFLCALSGIGERTLQNSAAYLQGWLRALKNDKTLLIKAAGQAQKAADFIRNLTYEPAQVV
jgi:antirestriction protein ArdC